MHMTMHYSTTPPSYLSSRHMCFCLLQPRKAAGAIHLLHCWSTQQRPPAPALPTLVHCTTTAAAAATTISQPSSRAASSSSSSIRITQQQEQQQQLGILVPSRLLLAVPSSTQQCCTVSAVAAVHCCCLVRESVWLSVPAVQSGSEVLERPGQVRISGMGGVHAGGESCLPVVAVVTVMYA